jgi:hypothetical protein
MNSTRSLVTAVGLCLCSQLAFAQDLSRYRAYVLQSGVDSVVAATGTRAGEARTLHTRPAIIKQLDWRAPHVDSRSTSPDPVREISFAFYNDALYEVIVTYDHDRTAGLTDSDMVELVSAAYGKPMPAPATTRRSQPLAAFPDANVFARWESAESSVMLLRGSFRSELRLILTSKALSARARLAVDEAVRLDALEAPRREALQQKKEAADADAALDKARAANKAAFRP